MTDTKGRRPRMADIAREANVTRITVSRALSHPELVAKDTLVRIQSAIARTGYIPDQLARGMKADRSRIVSLAAPAQMSGVYGAMSEMLARSLFETGMVLNHFPLTDHVSQREMALRELAGWRPAVIVMIAGVTTEAMRETLRNARAPLVELLSYDPESACTCVGYDHYDAAGQLTRHLIDQGYQRITYAHSANPLNSLNGIRLAGFFDQIAQAGIKGTEQRVEPGFAHGAQLVDDLVAAGEVPDALMCGSDMVAVGALQACLARGMRVPEDIAICAFDGTELTAVTHPAMTSLDYPLERVAQAGAEEILRLVEAPEGAIRRRKIDAHVQPRQTT